VTRKARFLERQLRYAFRYRHYRAKLRSTYRSGWNHSGPRTYLKDPWEPANAKQKLAAISKATAAAEPPGLTESPGLIEVTGGTGYGEPVHQHVNHAAFEPHFPPASTKATIGWYGGHKRRRMYIGRKPGRLTGAQRKLWCSALIHFLEGYWPDWDPLTRSPSETEVLREIDPLPFDPVGSWE